MRSVRSDSGRKAPGVPYAGSASTLRTMSSDSAYGALLPSSKMGAIFLPTSDVGRSTSSFAMKRTSCLMPLRPKASRARTQKGQWS